MPGYIDQFLIRQKHLREDLELSRRDGTVEGYKGLSLQRLITLSVYGDHLPKVVQDSIRIAKERKEAEGGAADRSAATAAAALDVSKKSVRVATRASIGTMVSAFCAIISGTFAALTYNNNTANTRIAQISAVQYESLKKEIEKGLLNRLNRQRQVQSAKDKSEFTMENPFVPRKQPAP